MKHEFVVEDEEHCESFSKHASMDDAIEEIRRLSELPWDADPNRCPCMSWKTCSREWIVVEYDPSTKPYPQQVRRTDVICQIGSAGVRWIGLDGQAPSFRRMSQGAGDGPTPS